MLPDFTVIVQVPLFFAFIVLPLIDTISAFPEKIESSAFPGETFTGTAMLLPTAIEIFFGNERLVAYICAFVGTGFFVGTLVICGAVVGFFVGHFVGFFIGFSVIFSCGSFVFSGSFVTLMVGCFVCSCVVLLVGSGDVSFVVCFVAVGG